MGGSPEFFFFFLLISGRIKDLIKSSGTSDRGKSGSERHLGSEGGWISSAQVDVNFVTALKALAVDSRVCNENMNEERPEMQNSQVKLGSGAMEVSRFWEQGTDNQAQGSSGNFFRMICAHLLGS